jgi:hypothetical protein
MLNFAEQTGSGAVIVVWSLLAKIEGRKYIYTNRKNTVLAYHLNATNLTIASISLRSINEL